MDITQLLAADRIITLKTETKDDALKALVKVLGKTSAVAKEKELAKAIMERERILSTGVGSGIAVPHAKIASVREFVAALGISKAGVPFDSQDHLPVHIMIMVAGPEGQNEEYLRILARFTHILKSEQTQKRILEAKKPEQVMAILGETR